MENETHYSVISHLDASQEIKWNFEKKTQIDS